MAAFEITDFDAWDNALSDVCLKNMFYLVIISGNWFVLVIDLCRKKSVWLLDSFEKIIA